MEFLNPELELYISNHSSMEPTLLGRLSRETKYKVLNPRMLSGAYQGRLLSMISKLVKPKFILEIGTYTGYSALCLVEGLEPGGMLHTIDINEELYEMQRRYFNASPYGNQIHQHLGDAIGIIPKLSDTWDLAFIDADKENYPKYFELLVPRMRSGGLILADNVLWSGKVLPSQEMDDAETQALKQFNEMVKSDPRVDTVVMLPVRDGLTLCRVT